jgi:hypothetical protein
MPSHPGLRRGPRRRIVAAGLCRYDNERSISQRSVELQGLWTAGQSSCAAGQAASHRCQLKLTILDRVGERW